MLCIYCRASGFLSVVRDVYAKTLRPVQCNARARTAQLFSPLCVATHAAHVGANEFEECSQGQYISVRTYVI